MTRLTVHEYVSLCDTIAVELGKERRIPWMN
jgi:hypothetical protein